MIWFEQGIFGGDFFFLPQSFILKSPKNNHCQWEVAIYIIGEFIFISIKMTQFRIKYLIFIEFGRKIE
jgi:hypothetical protein